MAYLRIWIHTVIAIVTHIELAGHIMVGIRLSHADELMTMLTIGIVEFTGMKRCREWIQHNLLG